MASGRKFKVVLLLVFSVVILGWLVSASYSPAHGDPVIAEVNLMPGASQDDYVGSETCATCHEDQFKNFSKTKHAKLKEVASWKNKAQGCESCHGPGKAHVEESDPTKIISFKNKNSKQISETCLTCHSGEDTHNNYRRGEHWRNNVGCTDCHSAHGTEPGKFQIGSVTFIGDDRIEKPGFASTAMLKASDPQLCVACHTETKAQFAKQFRHKVFEGTMKCGDCHNPHGGFESKQAKLAVGADASCVQCHTDKRGPFVFEHAPVRTEGCSVCHTPHGSNNAKLLKRNNVRQLCVECHTNLSGADDPAPQAPHRMNTLRYQTCNTCHTSVHGSNSDRFFFR